MKTRNIRLKSRVSACSWIIGLWAGSAFPGGPVLPAVGADVFTVDTSQSRVTVSGSVSGSTLQEQGPGSLTTQFGGSLLVAISGNTIQFPGQSQVVALNSGSWEPRADGSDGSEPANYGGKASHFLARGVAAIRHAQVDVTSGTVPLVDGRFGTQAITFSIPIGAPSSLAYQTEGAFDSSGAVPLGGRSATGQQSEGSLTVVGGQQVLTIPINYRVYFSLLSENDTVVYLNGQLVAYKP